MQTRLKRVFRAPPDLGRRRIFIQGYSFPLALRDRVSEAYEPALTPAQTALVFEGLRSWFLACTHADGRVLGMPSHAVDDAWHEFILMTREYHAFCAEAFGHYLHHTPDTAMADSMGDALTRTLRVLEQHPSGNVLAGSPGLPLLFTIDGELGIENGYEWTDDAIADLRSAKRGGCTAVGSGGSCIGSGDGGGGCGGGGCGGG